MSDSKSKHASHAEREPSYLVAQKGIKSWLFTVDHKRLGLMYLGSTLFFFFIAGLARGRRDRRAAPAQDTREQGKGFALGTLLMTGATWFMRSQFGGPVGFAQFVLSKVRGGRSPATAVPAEAPVRVPR